MFHKLNVRRDNPSEDAQAGDHLAAAEDVPSLIYDELRKLAAAKIALEPQTTCSMPQHLCMKPTLGWLEIKDPKKATLPLLPPGKRCAKSSELRLRWAPPMFG